MEHAAYVERLIDLMNPQHNVLLNTTQEAAAHAVATGDVDQVRAIDGQFAIVQKQGKLIRMARSIGRPMRYFIAKRHSGPSLIVAERIDEIVAYLKQEGLDDQFHPSYTRMVPAHYLVEIALLGCPDPNPTYTRYFAPERNRWSTDLDDIGARYIGALAQEIHRWLETISTREPIGVLFSGGIDSGAVLLTVYDALLKRGESPSRLKAFTLTLDGQGDDLRQAREFLDRLDLGLLLEPIDVPSSELQLEPVIRVLEDYKPLDVQAAAMTWALCRGIRARYPEWTWLVDGEGGDENLKDYPIEANPELTIRSVLNNLMLYQEGWGVHSIKHSLTYSGGQSRGHARSSAPVQAAGFRGFSPFALPNVIDVAEGIPFIELTNWDHEKLYALKGEIVRRGIAAVTGHEMPINPKRRFQHGATAENWLQERFPDSPAPYRRVYQQVFGV